MAVRVLVVDNDPEMVRLLQREFAGEGWTVEGATSGATALETLKNEDVEVVLTDLVMDGVDGIELLRAAQRHEPAPRVILMTAYGSLETAIEAMRHGAYDYLTKPFKLAEASVAVTRALDDRRLRDENRRLREQVDKHTGVDSIV